MVVAIPEDGLGEGWQDLGNGLMSKRLMRFRQRDIDEGRVYYKHFGMEGTSDYFMFEVGSHNNVPFVSFLFVSSVYLYLILFYVLYM